MFGLTSANPARPTRRRPLTAVAAAAVLALAAAACTTERSARSTATSTAPLGEPTSGGDEPSEDVMTPLIATALGDPIPVEGTDGRVHVAYELQLLNGAPRDATISAVETVDVASGEVVATIDADEIVARSVLMGSAPSTPTPVTSVPAGRTVVVLMDDIYAARDEVPDEVTHRITATFAPPAPDQAAYAAAIFLHRHNYGGGATSGTVRPTSGCVSLAHQDLLDTLRLIDPALNPHFAIGPTNYLRTTA